MALTRSRGRSARASAPAVTAAGVSVPAGDAAGQDQVSPAEPAPLTDKASAEEITAAADAFQALADSVTAAAERDKAEADQVMADARATADRIMAEATRKAGELAGWPALERRRQEAGHAAGQARSLRLAARDQAAFLAVAGRVADLAGERQGLLERAAGLAAELAGLADRRAEAQARRADAITGRDHGAVKAADADLAAGEAIAADCERERGAALARAAEIYDDRADSGELAGAVSEAQRLDRSVHGILSAVWPERAEALADAERERDRDAFAIVGEHVAAMAGQGPGMQRRPALARRQAVAGR